MKEKKRLSEKELKDVKAGVIPNLVFYPCPQASTCFAYNPTRCRFIVNPTPDVTDMDCILG